MEVTDNELRVLAHDHRHAGRIETAEALEKTALLVVAVQAAAMWDSAQSLVDTVHTAVEGHDVYVQRAAEHRAKFRRALNLIDQWDDE